MSHPLYRVVSLLFGDGKWHETLTSTISRRETRLFTRESPMISTGVNKSTSRQLGSVHISSKWVEPQLVMLL